MIILDGFDNTGKTTLALKLSQEFGLEYLHSPSEYRYDRDRMMSWATRAIGAETPAIYDRFSPITDQVYSPILRGSNPYGDTHRGRAIVELLKHTPHLIVYTRCSRDTILGFSDGRDQMEGVQEKGSELLDAYDRFFQRLQREGFNIVGYNYEQEGDYAYVMNMVKDFLEQHKEGM